MVNSRKGLTLIELLLAGSLLALAVFALGQVVNASFKHLFSFSKTTDRKSRFVELNGHLQKNLTSGDLRLFGFTGFPEDPLARVMLPLPSLCGDLVSKCPNDTSIFYIHYQRSMPSVTSLCLLSTEVDTQSNTLITVIVDGSNSTYGSVDLSDLSKGFQISQSEGDVSSGIVESTENKILALLDPPNATLWTVVKPPIKFSPTWDATNKTFDAAFVNANCVSNLQLQDNSLGSGPPYQVEKLYQVKLKPFSLTQFTGQQQRTITDSIIRNSLGTFPLRLFSVTPRSVGRHLSADNKTGYVEIRNCESQEGVVRCQGTGLPRIDQIDRMRIDIGFSLALTNTVNASLGTSRPSRYEVRVDDMLASDSCRLNDCAFLKLADPSRIPYRLSLGGGITEDFTNLSDMGYSLIKNLSISQIRFRLINEGSEDYFDVSFR